MLSVFNLWQEVVFRSIDGLSQSLIHRPDVRPMVRM
jgi:hypothetical protein